MVDPWFRDQPATMFYCGDDEAAKAVVRQLTEDLDLEPVDAGPLVNAFAPPHRSCTGGGRFGN
jgi:predicted dinucleotide-binding enzyme